MRAMLILAPTSRSLPIAGKRKRKKRGESTRRYECSLDKGRQVSGSLEGLAVKMGVVCLSSALLGNTAVFSWLEVEASLKWVEEFGEGR